MRKTALMMLLAASGSLATAEQMVWKIVSPAGIVSATVFNDIRKCRKALAKYHKASTCVALPAPAKKN